MHALRQTVLAIADDGHTRKVIRAGLPSEKYTLCVSPNLEGGLRSFLDIKPSFIVMSIATPSLAGLECLTEIIEADPQARVIVMCPSTDNAFVLECIRHGASDYLRTPLMHGDLQRSIDRISSRSTLLKKCLEPDLECVRSERKILEFGNNIEDLPYIINQAVANASVVCPDVPMLKMALGEVLINAIEHGNLGISMKEKSAALAKETYPDLIAERMRDPRYAGRRVTLRVSMTRGRLTYRVIDQGDGFDHKTLFHRDPHSAVGSGLGLFVAESFFARLMFIGRGNEVVMVYRRPRKGS
jgi:CheY-like chemotaxis protein